MMNIIAKIFKVGSNLLAGRETFIIYGFVTSHPYSIESLNNPHVNIFVFLSEGLLEPRLNVRFVNVGKIYIQPELNQALLAKL